MTAEAKLVLAMAAILSFNPAAVLAVRPATIDITKRLLEAYRVELTSAVEAEAPGALSRLRGGRHSESVLALFRARDEPVYQLGGVFWAEVCRAASAPCVPALASGLDDRDPAWRAFSAEALGALGDSTAVPHLVALLWDQQVVPEAFRCIPGDDESRRCVHTVAHSASLALGKLAGVDFRDDLEAWRRWSLSQ